MKRGLKISSLALSLFFAFGAALGVIQPIAAPHAEAATCTAGWTDIGGGCRMFITTTGDSTFSVPSDWNSASSTIEAIGSGANGDNGPSGPGGGAGAYAKKNNATLTSGSTVNIHVDAANAGVSTWLKDNGGTKIVEAASGSGSTGGTTAASTGDVKNAGGNGGSTLSSEGGTGGGGAGGPLGPGAKGGDQTDPGNLNDGGTGGGGANNGTAGVDGSDNNGTAGGTNGNSVGNGGHGGAKVISGSSHDGDPGVNDQFWDATHGVGAGGGGGGSHVLSGTPGNGGAGDGYGAAGGGAGRSPSGGATGGTGVQGILVITYTPAAAPAAPTDDDGFYSFWW